MVEDAKSRHAPDQPRSLAGKIGRRAVLSGLSAITLSGCVADGWPDLSSSAAAAEAATVSLPVYYRGLTDEGFNVPSVDIDRVPRRFWRREVTYETDEKPGTIVVDTPARYLYHVRDTSRAVRYGVGIGREGFEWSGRAIVAYRRKWPRWVPPASMIARQPELAAYAAESGGMEPGLRNPLGARALYIHSNGQDTLYRIHGTNEPESIGKAVSSGCIRMINQDVIHLHAHVSDGSRIAVIQDPGVARVDIADL